MPELDETLISDVHAVIESIRESAGNSSGDYALAYAHFRLGLGEAPRALEESFGALGEDDVERIRAQVNAVVPAADVIASRGEAAADELACAYCTSEVTLSANLFFCPSCGSAHHEDCWIENTRCAVRGCGGLAHVTLSDDQFEQQGAVSVIGSTPVETAAEAVSPVAADVMPMQSRGDSRARGRIALRTAVLIMLMVALPVAGAIGAKENWFSVVIGPLHTSAELEQAREAAHAAGYEEGRSAGYTDGYREGYESGNAAGCRRIFETLNAVSVVDYFDYLYSRYFVSSFDVSDC